MLLKNRADFDYLKIGVASPDKIRFMEIARNQGMKEAIAYRNRRFKPDA